jgi:methionyl-tRNA formyltransferase
MTLHRVASHNSDEMRTLLTQLDPDVAAVYGTRILSRKTLAAVDAPLINYHAGFNPKYRGQHPAYWPLVTGDTENAGVTLHAVDTGVDTGGVIYQAPVAFVPQDTIASYQTLQAATGIPLFTRA